jgi:hypothetical protein
MLVPLPHATGPDSIERVDADGENRGPGRRAIARAS